jgi:hypothetical protein
MSTEETTQNSSTSVVVADEDGGKHSVNYDSMIYWGKKKKIKFAVYTLNLNQVLSALNLPTGRLSGDSTRCHCRNHHQCLFNRLCLHGLQIPFVP